MNTFLLLLEGSFYIVITILCVNLIRLVNNKLKTNTFEESKMSFDLFTDDINNKKDIEKMNLPSFDDIAGLTEVKQDLKKILDVFREQNKFKEKGALPPSGILFYGPPGCGKTMLAKAIAKECGVNFICRNAGDLVRNIGMGFGNSKSNLVEAFECARKHRPCVLFIDELDIFGSRNNNFGGRSELTQLIAEMDGMSDNDGVLIVGSTNNIYALDNALLRSGRFTKKYYIGNPESNDDIKELIDMYCKKDLMHNEITEKDMIRLSRGLSPSDIKSMFQISQTEAVTDDRLVRQVDLMRVKIELVSKGKQRLSSRFSLKELDTRIAVHEVGHVILTKYFNGYLDGVNILGLANTLGITAQSLEEGSELRTVREIIEQICINYGGVINEYIHYGSDVYNVSLGCSGDIKTATELIKYITYKNSLISDKSVLLDYSAIDDSIRMNYTEDIARLSFKCKKITEEILKENESISNKLIELLVEKKEISSVELNKFFRENELLKVDLDNLMDNNDIIM